jgi:hypothetical protein
VAGARKVIDLFANVATENGSTNDDPTPPHKMLPVAALLMLPSILLSVYLNHTGLESPMKGPGSRRYSPGA